MRQVLEYVWEQTQANASVTHASDAKLSKS